MHQFHPWPPLHDFVPPEQTNDLLRRILEAASRAESLARSRSSASEHPDQDSDHRQLPYEDEVTWRARLRLNELRTTLQSAFGARMHAAAQRFDILDGARADLKQVPHPFGRPPNKLCAFVHLPVLVCVQVVELLQLRELGIEEEARDTAEELPALLQPPPKGAGGREVARTAASLWRVGAKRTSAATAFRAAMLKAGVAVRDRRDGGAALDDDGTRVQYRLVGRQATPSTDPPPPRLPDWLDRPEPSASAAAPAPAPAAAPAAAAPAAAAAAPAAVVAAGSSASFEVDLRTQPIVTRWQDALAPKEKEAATTASASGGGAGGGGGGGGGGSRRRSVQKWNDAAFVAPWVSEPEGDTLLERLQWRSTKSSIEGSRSS